jgi:hypothetical protein
MIDISTETVVSPAEARRRLPTRRAGKRPDIATIYRWMQVGCRGIRLESIVIGGTRCTSIESLQRFFNKLTEAADSPAPDAAAPISTKAGQQRMEAAEQRLAAGRKQSGRPRGNSVRKAS